MCVGGGWSEGVGGLCGVWSVECVGVWSEGVGVWSEGVGVDCGVRVCGGGMRGVCRVWSVKGV